MQRQRIGLQQRVLPISSTGNPLLLTRPASVTIHISVATRLGAAAVACAPTATPSTAGRLVKPSAECLLAVDSAVSAMPMWAAIEEAFTIEFGVILAALDAATDDPPDINSSRRLPLCEAAYDSLRRSRLVWHHEPWKTVSFRRCRVPS